jgi:uncharacterized membrane protein YkvA (DUF1232 family)
MQSITPEKLEKAKEQFLNKIKEIDMDDVEYVLKKGLNFLKKIAANIPGPLVDLWDDIKLMWSLIRDYVEGNYKQVPWSTIAAIVGSLLYLFYPIDIIPDYVPLYGFLDDAIVITLALKMIKKDLDSYKQWMEENNKEILMLPE